MVEKYYIGVLLQGFLFSILVIWETILLRATLKLRLLLTVTISESIKTGFSCQIAQKSGINFDFFFSSH